MPAASREFQTPRPVAPPHTELALVASASAGTLHGPPGCAGVRVSGVSAASTSIRPGDLFVGLAGRTGHGIRYVPEAIERGAVAVLTDEAGMALLHAPGARPNGSPVIVVDDVRGRLGSISSQIYGFPSVGLQMLGVTGTSGKTTVTYFIRAGLAAAGIHSGLIGTVATMLGAQEIPSGFTTPEAPELQALLAVMLEEGAESVVMEVSSHALSMGRASGIDFAVAAFTNLSQDHLDFHPSMEDYFLAKATLFEATRTSQAVVCIDDEWGQRLAGELTERLITVATEPALPAQWRAEQITTDAAGRSAFLLRTPFGSYPASVGVPGRYNVANAVTALAMLSSAGVSPEVAIPAIAQASVPGRMERIECGQPFLTVVDYSHKPAAVAGAINALAPLTQGRLIIVLGCGGDRDRGKRPQMGVVAAQGSDVLVITDDNPRSEVPAQIRREILAGVEQVPLSQRADVLEIGDRRAAIERALRLARAGDTVLIAGKGHESGQEIGAEVLPFDDRQVAIAILEAIAADTGKIPVIRGEDQQQ